MKVFLLYQDSYLHNFIYQYIKLHLYFITPPPPPPLFLPPPPPPPPRLRRLVGSEMCIRVSGLVVAKEGLVVAW